MPLLKRLEPKLHHEVFRIERITLPESDRRPVRQSKVIAVMPAYNAEKTLAATLVDVPVGSVDEVILVDDQSTDRTVQIAREIGLTVIEHPRNRGYGGNQKTCYRHALDRGAHIVVMIHPDYQYDSRVIPLAVSIIELGICDVVLGSRIRSRQEALAGGMPRYKYFSNRFLTAVENLALGQNLGDFHSGFRVYRREVLERIPFEGNSDDFVFDTQFLVQAVHFGFRLGDIPVPVRYFAEASSINFRRSVQYGFGTLATVAQFWLHHLGLWRYRLFEPKVAHPPTLPGAPHHAISAARVD
jgi:glycosyltransferase involved in cell wall biosynthesis